MEIIVTMRTTRVISISQHKIAAVSYLTVNILAILRPKIWYEDVSSSKQSVLLVVAWENLVTIVTRQVIDILVV